ncbi:formiminoglutamase [Lentibacillus halodurans]|uniref:Formimidoylglutamase n=1 Tax=Lentibacillus halodurans TaxID=237679 RepID=A0A1I0X465_9BACI|nr:formimidoylglutamase [Lentibacillus halodurans]SFA95644.1 formiminoglutamase [Lentibacillus halodurans]
MGWSIIYIQADNRLWNGRIDDTEDPASYRFHQDVQVMNLNELASDQGAFGIIGFASDEGVKRNKGRQGAAQAPDLIRQCLAKLPYNLDCRTFDVGNVYCEGSALEEAQGELGRHVAGILQTGIAPIILGGGHETLYGHYLGAREYVGPDITVGMINIDAHFDMRSDSEPSSGTMFRQILEQDTHAGYLCLGIQEFGNTKALFQTAKAYGCEYILDKHIDHNDFRDTFAMIDNFSKRYDYLMMTLCTDSIAASAAPGVSAPSPLGLDPKTVRMLLTYVARKGNLLSFDISEVNPLVDENEKTIRLAAYLVAETMRNFHK